jgi:hypothetical protein
MFTVPVLRKVTIGDYTEEEIKALSLPCPEDCLQLLGGELLHSSDREEGRQAHQALLDVSARGGIPHIARDALSLLGRSPFWAPMRA